MEQAKIRFFSRIKNAIFNFDKYQIFAAEKTGTAIKYFLKLMIIFSVIYAIFTTIKMGQLLQNFQSDIPEFKIENNNLVLNGDEKEIIKENSSLQIAIIANSEKENLNDIENSNYPIIIALLKDKVVVKYSYNNIETSKTYEEIGQQYQIYQKSDIINYIQNKAPNIYTSIFIMSLIPYYISYSITIFISILVLALIGFIVSRIINVRFKMNVILNMSIYSITLSVVLYIIYIGVNIFTGFTAKYFEIAYNAIAYIYLITAMLIIKTDLIKQQMELAKIMEIQKKVENQEEQPNDEQEKKPDEENKKDEKKKNEEKNSSDKKEKEPDTPPSPAEN
jgi:hypothetical protein